jgi:hypothetical protein
MKFTPNPSSILPKQKSKFQIKNPSTVMNKNFQKNTLTPRYALAPNLARVGQHGISGEPLGSGLTHILLQLLK